MMPEISNQSSFGDSLSLTKRHSSSPACLWVHHGGWLSGANSQVAYFALIQKVFAYFCSFPRSSKTRFSLGFAANSNLVWNPQRSLVPLHSWLDKSVPKQSINSKSKLCSWQRVPQLPILTFFSGFCFGFHLLGILLGIKSFILTPFYYLVSFHLVFSV